MDIRKFEHFRKIYVSALIPTLAKSRLRRQQLPSDANQGLDYSENAGIISKTLPPGGSCHRRRR